MWIKQVFTDHCPKSGPICKRVLLSVNASTQVWMYQQTNGALAQHINTLNCFHFNTKSLSQVNSIVNVDCNDNLSLGCTHSEIYVHRASLKIYEPRKVYPTIVAYISPNNISLCSLKILEAACSWWMFWISAAKLSSLKCCKSDDTSKHQKQITNSYVQLLAHQTKFHSFCNCSRQNKYI